MVRHAARRTNSTMAARRISPARLIPHRWMTRRGRISYTCAAIQKACTPSAGATFMAAAASSTACATRSAIASVPPTSRASRRRYDGCVSHTRRWPDRSRASAHVQLRRQTIYRLPRRHACLGAVGQWRAPGRAFIQVSPAARHPVRRIGRTQRAGDDRSRCRTHHAEPARDATRVVPRDAGTQPEPLPFARVGLRCDQQRARTAVARRLLLQDLHVAARILAACL